MKSLAQDDTAGKWVMGFEPRQSGSRMNSMRCLSAQQALGACGSLQAGCSPPSSLTCSRWGFLLRWVASPSTRAPARPLLAPLCSGRQGRGSRVPRRAEHLEPLGGLSIPVSITGSFFGGAEMCPDCLPSAPPHRLQAGGPVPVLTFLWLLMSRPFSLRSFTNVLAR